MELKKIVTKSKKRIGRGHGSGKVKTSGRGTKGQNARGRVHPGFEGGQLALIKRLPYLRGKGRNESRKIFHFALPVIKLVEFPEETVTLESLRKYHMIGDARAVKLIGGGELSKAFIVEVPVSKSAKNAIEKSGGKIVTK